MAAVSRKPASDQISVLYGSAERATQSLTAAFSAESTAIKRAVKEGRSQNEVQRLGNDAAIAVLKNLFQPETSDEDIFTAYEIARSHVFSAPPAKLKSALSCAVITLTNLPVIASDSSSLASYTTTLEAGVIAVAKMRGVNPF